MTPFLWALLTAFIWGFVPIIEKLGLAKIEPMVGLFYRCLGVVVGIFLLLAFESKDIRASLGALHPGMIYLVVGGFLASVAGQFCFYFALKSGEASKVVPLAAAYPLIAFVLGLFFLGEKITSAKVIGIVLVILGVVFLK